VRLPFPAAMVAVVLFALLVSQAASSVCAVQCAQHPAMDHCHAMAHANRVALKSCATGGFCTVDLLANRQPETAGSTGIHVDVRSGVFLSTLSPASFTDARRSNVSPPPLVTALRI
jgi:hypothetical protein